MNDLLGQLTGQLGPDFIKNVATSIGTDEEKTKSMIDMAVPFITKSLEKKTANEAGAKLFEAALEKKHDGSIFSSITDLISNPDEGEGAGILKHLLGSKEKEVEALMAKKSGTKPEQSNQVMKILAPIILGALGKKKKSGLNISSILEMVGGVNKKMEDPNSSMMMTFATQFLDKDGDGDIKDDLLNMGMKAFQDFLKEKYRKI